METAIHTDEIDIIGKEFEGIVFESDDKLQYHHSQYDKYIGVIGVVKKINYSYPEYSLVEFEGDSRYYYTKDIKHQISYKSSKGYIGDLYRKVFKILESNDRYFN